MAAESSMPEPMPSDAIPSSPTVATEELKIHASTCATFHAPYSTASCASVTVADFALFQVTGTTDEAPPLPGYAAAPPAAAALPPCATMLDALPVPPPCAPPWFVPPLFIATAPENPASALLESALLQPERASRADRPKYNGKQSRIRIFAYSGARYRL